ncbi:MAG TPA: histidine phosphatase family protein [Bacillota bacterium]|nr:histidine phosphatase family protein [Bacillota bacterium]
MMVAVVRHGETDWNTQGLIQGQTDIPLNDNGLRQARRAAAWFEKKGGWERLYSSPLSRALQTAEIIGAATQLAPQIIPGLMERRFGALEGLSLEERERLFPHRLEAEETVPGLESRSDLKERVIYNWRQIVNQPRQEKTGAPTRIVVVSHGGWIGQLLSFISDGKIGAGVTKAGNGSVFLLTRGDGLTWTYEEVEFEPEATSSPDCPFKF